MTMSLSALGTTVKLVADQAVEPGHQQIFISGGPSGEALASLLTGDSQPWARTLYAVPHTAEVDQRIMELINLLVAIRRAAPGLVQLGFDTPLG